MKRAAPLLCAALLAMLPLSAFAEDGDRSTVTRASLEVGEQVAVRLEVTTEDGQSVEINPGGPSWNGVELVRVAASASRPAGGKTLHTLDIVVAAFVPGEVEFQPSVTVVAGAEASPRLLPAVKLNVLSSLRPGEPLELSPLPPPVSIGGAESPLLKPALGLGGLAALALLVALAVSIARRLTRRAPAVSPPAASPVPPTLLGAERDIVTDPVTAYRTLASVVRSVLGQRYGFPAPSLTTHELKRRMEAAGVDRWQARLVEGLLEECDAVVYAGYRPAVERREADLTMAREIVEAVS
ncbi:MAG: hypothetical protein C0506_02260 [Anaerolinea sp.]|nr:hypothetical protein [Anaerolinea sp.]